MDVLHADLLPAFSEVQPVLALEELLAVLILEISLHLFSQKF